MSLAKLHRTMPTTIWIYPTCCHTFGKSPTNARDFQKIPTNSKRFHYNLENSNFPGGQSLLGDFSYFYNTWQTECLRLTLPNPHPILLPFNLHAGFITSYNSSFGNALLDSFIDRLYRFCHSGKHIGNGALTHSDVGYAVYKLD